MSDPFDVLRRPIGATTPPPDLRERVLSELRSAAQATEPYNTSTDTEIPEVVMDLALAPIDRSRRYRRGLVAAAVVGAVVTGSFVHLTSHTKNPGAVGVAQP